MINPQNVLEMCRHNKEVAESFGRHDLIQAWSIAETIGLALGSSEIEMSDEEMFSSPNPFGRSFLEAL